MQKELKLISKDCSCCMFINTPYVLTLSILRRREEYYHTDHLGSATLITDDAADVVQQIAYLPYGEDWVDIRHHGYFGLACRICGAVAFV